MNMYIRMNFFMITASVRNLVTPSVDPWALCAVPKASLTYTSILAASCSANTGSFFSYRHIYTNDIHIPMNVYVYVYTHTHIYIHAYVYMGMYI